MISFVYNETLVQLSGSLTQYEIPLFAVLEGAPYPLFLCMAAVLFSHLYDNGDRSVRAVQPHACICEIAEMDARISSFSCDGAFYDNRFSDLIAILYPIYGLLSLYLLVCLLLYPILGRWKKV